MSGRKYLKAMLAASACALALSAAGVAAAETRDFAIPAGDLSAALDTYARQSGVQIIYRIADVSGVRTDGVQGALSSDRALAQLLEGTNFQIRRDQSGAIAIAQKVDAAPQSGSAAGGGAEVEALIVTAQKKEEAIQDVPIAISAFTQKSLEEQKIEGGFDLVKAIPNVSFSKNNFSGYNFSIRGIGTKAVSVTTDPGVAVAFNSTTMIRNRLFEQEYYDLERVEVLRGPQGTLYGRNATSGVINVISATPELDEFKGSIKGEVGNYHAKRIVAMVNVPLVEEKLAVRLAGAMTARDGFGINLYNNKPVDGRDLWSTRLTIGFEATERIRANLIWERFREDDNRSRTGKQLCKRDPGPDQVGDFVLPSRDEEGGESVRGSFTQGCLPVSLYDDSAFEAPNGFAIPFVGALQLFAVGNGKAIEETADPYGDTTQSRDLRALYSQLEAVYRAGADVLELNADFDLTDKISLSSQTAYNRDRIYSTQDFNRYTTFPAFTATLPFLRNGNPNKYKDLVPAGIFCDPQLGCSNTIVGMDLSRAKSHQFSQEFRVQSAFDGPLDFSAGINYTRYSTIEDYYVFFNGITLAAILNNSSTFFFGGTHPSKVTTNPDCSALRADEPYTDQPDGLFCVPIEANPISQIQDTGHNYFLSRNPYKLDSRAAFGELYWRPNGTLNVTAGLRYTDDIKVFTPIPSQTFLTDSQRATDAGSPILAALAFFGGPEGHPALPEEKRRWREVTGRLGFDWKPDLPFTDQTMLYAFYSRGYKGGGLNPPRPGLNYDLAASVGIFYGRSAPAEFRPEFVNAFEIGAKNTLLSGALVLNAGAFFYDYKDYQVSKIVDRSAQNENFDAKVWGLELESVFQPTRNLRVNASLGYLDTELADGSKSIDILNRTAGNPDWMIVKPAVTLTSNCIVPVEIVQKLLEYDASGGMSTLLCPGGEPFGGTLSGKPPLGSYWPEVVGFSYDPADHPEANFGAGFDTDVSGHELPNSPHWTVTLGGQYSYEFLEGWKATVRADFYWQSQQWARIYQSSIDKLRAWKNGNLSLLIERPDDGLALEIYAKNIFDDTPITDTFTNSDDTALTTNIFVLDPRLLGLSIKKTF